MLDGSSDKLDDPIALRCLAVFFWNHSMCHTAPGRDQTCILSPAVYRLVQQLVLEAGGSSA